MGHFNVESNIFQFFNCSSDNFLLSDFSVLFLEYLLFRCCIPWSNPIIMGLVLFLLFNPFIIYLYNFFCKISSNLSCKLSVMYFFKNFCYQTKTNTVWFYLYVESKNTNKWTSLTKHRVIDTKNKHCCHREGSGWRIKIDEGVKRYKVNYKINESWTWSAQVWGI